MRFFNEKTVSLVLKTFTKYDKTGYLLKKRSDNKSFKRRYFILLHNLLFYFQKKPLTNDVEPSGVILLEDFIVLDNEDPKQPFSFKISFLTDKYVFAAESEGDMKDWFQALITVIIVSSIEDKFSVDMNNSALDDYSQEIEEDTRKIFDRNYNPFDATLNMSRNILDKEICDNNSFDNATMTLFKLTFEEMHEQVKRYLDN